MSRGRLKLVMPDSMVCTKTVLPSIDDNVTLPATGELIEIWSAAGLGYTPKSIASCRSLIAAFSATLSVTVIDFVAKQPVAVTLYVIIEDPRPVPDTIPEADPIDATDGVALDQLPPIVAFDRVVDAPIVTVAAPEIAAGEALMVIVAVLKHPVPSE